MPLSVTRSPARLAIVLAALWTMTSTGLGPNVRAGIVPPSTASSFVVDDTHPKVLLIGLDGIRPDALEAANTPVLDRLIATGAFSDRAQAGDRTWSGPAWASVLTGVWRDKHGVVDNTFRGERLVRCPDVFGLLDRGRPGARGASIVAWPPINRLINRHASYTYTFHNSWTKADDRVEERAAETLRRVALDLVFVHFGDADKAGHDHGFHPAVAPYTEAIEAIDSRVGRLLHALAARPTLHREDWLVLVTTDHGGTRNGHGGSTPEDRTTFMLAHGGAFEAGSTLWPPPKVVDVAPTVLTHLGVEIPHAWSLDGRPLQDGLERPESRLGRNLLINGDGELDAPGAGHLWVDLPTTGWGETGSGTVARYGGHKLPNRADPGPRDRGRAFFAGGTEAVSVMTQRIDLSPLAKHINTGRLSYEFSAYLGGYESQTDSAWVHLQFLDASGKPILEDRLGPTTVAQREAQTALLPWLSLGDVPPSARWAECTVRMQGDTGGNDGYADNIALRLAPQYAQARNR